MLIFPLRSLFDTFGQWRGLYQNVQSNRLVKCFKGKPHFRGIQLKLALDFLMKTKSSVSLWEKRNKSLFLYFFLYPSLLIQLIQLIQLVLLVIVEKNLTRWRRESLEAQKMFHPNLSRESFRLKHKLGICVLESKLFVFQQHSFIAFLYSSIHCYY